MPTAPGHFCSFYLPCGFHLIRNRTYPSRVEHRRTCSPSEPSGSPVLEDTASQVKELDHLGRYQVSHFLRQFGHPDKEHWSTSWRNRTSGLSARNVPLQVNQKNGPGIPGKGFLHEATSRHRKADQNPTSHPTDQARYTTGTAHDCPLARLDYMLLMEAQNFCHGNLTDRK